MKIEHMGLYVRDLEATRHFFETYFEATSSARYHNQKTGFQSYFLTFDEGARLEIMTRGEDLADGRRQPQAALYRLPPSSFQFGQCRSG